MPFFLPRRLIDWTYFDAGNTEPDEEAKPYQNDMDFAFFASNFGFSKRDYNEMTRREIAFLLKAYETRTVEMTQYLYNAVYTAVYNAMRGKNKRALKLWHKRKTQKADMETIQENINIVMDVESKEGKGWVDIVLAANGIKKGGGGNS